MAGPIRSIDESKLQQLLLERAEAVRTALAGKIPPRFRPYVAVDDVLQEIWITAFRSVSSFRLTRPDAFDRWLAAIVSRRLADALRIVGALKRGGNQRILKEHEARSKSFADLFGRLASPQKSPSREVSAREAADAVQLALCGLSESRRQAVRMRYIEGRSRAEIAQVLRKSDAAVNSLLYHGLREMRERLGSACRFLSNVSASDVYTAAGGE
jgi:RNA polymerase sigma factor (sigma-70 family)